MMVARAPVLYVFCPTVPVAGHAVSFLVIFNVPALRRSEYVTCTEAMLKDNLPVEPLVKRQL